MNYIKNPTLRPAVFPKVKDASENYSIGIQYNDRHEITAEQPDAIAVLYPGFTAYGYVAYNSEGKTFTPQAIAEVDLPFWVTEETPEQYIAEDNHPIKVRCWRVISQQLHISCIDPNVTGIWEAIRIPTHSFKGIRWIHPTEDYEHPSLGLPDYNEFNLFKDPMTNEYQNWENHPSYVTGTFQDFNRCYFQLNLQHQHWPWVCQCCKDYCQTPPEGGGVDVPEVPIDNGEPGGPTGPIEPPPTNPGTGGPGTGGGGSQPIVPFVPPVRPNRPANNDYTGTKPPKTNPNDDGMLDDTEITQWDEPLIMGNPDPTVWNPPPTLPVKISRPGETEVIQDVDVDEDGWLETQQIANKEEPPVGVTRPQMVTSTDPLVRGEPYRYMTQWINDRRKGDNNAQGQQEGNLGPDAPDITYDLNLSYLAQTWADRIASDPDLYDEWRRRMDPVNRLDGHDMPEIGDLGTRLEDLGITWAGSGIYESLGTTNVQDTFKAFLAEGPGGDKLNHWDIMMNPDLTRFGIGSAITHDGQYITIFLPSTREHVLNLQPVQDFVNVPATYDNWVLSWDNNDVGGIGSNDLQLPKEWWQWTIDERRTFQEYVQTAKQQPWGVFPLLEVAPIQAMTNPEQLPEPNQIFDIILEEPPRPWINSTLEEQSPQDAVNGNFGSRYTRLDQYDRTLRVMDRRYSRLVNAPTTNIWPNQTDINRQGTMYKDWPILVYEFALRYDVTQMSDPLGVNYASIQDFLIYEFWVYHRQFNQALANMDMMTNTIPPEEIFFQKNTDPDALWEYVVDFAERTIPFPFPDADEIRILEAMKGKSDPMLAPPKWGGDYSLYTYDTNTYPIPDKKGMVPEEEWFTFSGLIPTEIIVNYANAEAAKWNKSPLTLALILFLQAQDYLGQFEWPNDFFIDVSEAVPTNIDTEIVAYVDSKPVDARFFSTTGHKQYLALLWYNYLTKIPLDATLNYIPNQFPLFKLGTLTTTHWPSAVNYRGVMNWAKTQNTNAWEVALRTTTRTESNAYSTFISNLFYPKVPTFTDFAAFDNATILDQFYATHKGYPSRYDKKLHEEHAISAKTQRIKSNTCDGMNWLEERQAAYNAALAARQAEIAAAIAAYDAAVAYRNSEIARIDAARQALVDARNAEIAAAIAAYNAAVTARTNQIAADTAARDALVAAKVRWPPIALTSNSTVVTGQTYGNGTYVIGSYSQYVDPPNNVYLYSWQLFDRTVGANKGWCTATQSYDSTTGNYTSSTGIGSTTGPISGEWINIAFPQSVILRSYYVTSGYEAGLEGRTPRTFGLYGWSISEANWKLIDRRVDQTGWGLQERRTYNCASPELYKDFVFQIERTNGGDGFCAFAELGLFETVDPPPINPADYPEPVYPDTTPLSLPPVPICGEEPPPPGETPYTPLYTKVPEIGQACIEAQTDLSPLHTPEALNLSNWPTWDGSTTINQFSTPAELAAWIWPNGRLQMRGLKDLFNTIVPFYNTTSPTIAEIEDWHVEVIMLLRRLVGKGHFTMTKSPELFLETQWASERKWSTVWDAAYPTDTCPSGSAAHCGWNFIPSAADQEPYYQLPNQGTVGFTAASEGIFTIEKSLNWAVKFSAMMCDVISLEGNNGHGGPMFRRGSMGVSFMCDGSANTTVRCQWGAPLYTEP